ncbi:class I SAM-dependent methyltransferase [Lentzea sp. NPDC059081]|uniref:class I SAM-dependent methyltransferase n=1 Tax=Lentzea sp. NPDC059081 TaxID=3346719 RepID=UPI0036B4C517
MADTTIDKVLAAAVLPEHAAVTAIAELGPDVVAEAVLAEVAALTQVLPGPGEKVPVQWELAFGGDALAYVMTVGGQGVTVEQGRVDSPDVVVAQDLSELLRSVYGEAGKHDATREVTLHAPDGPPESDPDGSLARRRALAISAGRTASHAASRHPADLTELAISAGADKWGRHYYTDVYERYFGALRDRQVRVLEIGCDQGESALMWTHYFRRGRLVRVDSRDKAIMTPPRAVAVHGAQDDEDFLAGVARDHGPFDVIIDDGSHVNSHVTTSFTALFPHLRPGGLYVVEDVGASYWPGWGGSSTDLSSPSTTVGFVKTLLDGLNYQQHVREDDDYEPTLTERTVSGVCMHHNIVFVEKSRNTQRGAPKWVTNAKSALFL